MSAHVRTSYAQSEQLFPSKNAAFWYAVLVAALIAAPYVLESYYLSQLVFVLIYAIVGIAMNVLSGQAGQVSIGHAAFMAIGAYSAAVAEKYGLPLPVYLVLAGGFTGLIGYLVGLPALRLHGIYLAIATLAFAFIVEEIVTRWESVTNGNEGLMLGAPSLFGLKLGAQGFYYLCLGVTVVVILAAINILRSPTGRAFLAIRDSETAARSMGIDTARYKTRAFAISAAFTGLAGVLYAHKLSFISPEMFSLSMSIEFVMIIIIGGVLSLRGAVFGAIFMIIVDPILIVVKDKVPQLTLGAMQGVGLSDQLTDAIQAGVVRVAGAPGLKSLIFGLIIILFIIFEPMGLDGRWARVKSYFRQFPLYRPTSARAQRMFLKSERNR
ncbi:branched-chain amino acid ABC transporter permease [Rhodopseudomonas palustris]|uniref:branched-chain amino acid ABC transporter permease n=1 Tax=Rhodopseudomonas palustris TaxID=1076 RepID=UPI000E5C1226|nr:branched-chain amino acid ABC transporter permease [Rhodopseudomonas palustris]QLH70398.1 branched-chain amino acid ABC transporter permease [Rhodopseudomonas palustris]RHZ97137.1 branched-chain amino acid ABC transporter permease [Rhodopseudomonas palustris]